MDIDQMLAKCGDFHRYQILLMGLFCVINILSAMQYYSQTIISFVPEHWCLTNSTINYTIQNIRNLTKGSSDFSCTPIIDPPIQADNASLHKKCDKWLYDLDHNYISMTSDLNWVCEDAWKSSLGQSMFFVGSVLGTLYLGMLADKIGRLPVLVIAYIVSFVGNLLTIFSTTVPTFSLFRFIAGLATDSNFVMIYILVMEYLRPSMRTFGLNLCIGVFYCLGSAITPWIAVWLGDWKAFLLATALPALIVPGFYFIIPESAQWLISKRKTERAIQCFQKIAYINGRRLDKESVEEFEQMCRSTYETEGKVNPSMVGLFKTPRLRRNTLILFFKSMVITLCYDAISKNVEGLGLSPFIMFSLSAAAILPACLVLLLLQDRIGRKAMASSSLLISGLFTSATGIVIVYQKGEQDAVLLATLAIVGRFGVTVAYNSAAQYAAELIPTCVRAQGIAAAHVAGYALTFFSSYILLLATVFKPLPSLILGTLSLIGAILCLFLPETMDRPLPVTLKDGEEFGRGERFFDFACCDRSPSGKTESTTILPTQ